MEEQEHESYVKAGKIAKETLDWAASNVREGGSILELAEQIEARIIKEGAGIAFPVNLSINDAAAHYTPKSKDTSVFTKEDVVKVDLGCHVDGYIADTATTVDLTGKYSKMLEANERALIAAIDLVKPGMSVSKIGETVQQIISSAGYKPIENLTGHQIKQYDLHAGLSIPNIKVPYDWQIEEGMVLAIEPFVTDGAGHVIEGRKPQIYSMVSPKPVRMREARILLKAILERQELPFAARWYSDILPPIRFDLALTQLCQTEILKAYPPLHDKGKGIVSQFEHTLIVTEDGCEVTTR